jgi:hypothetical protein
VQSVPITTKVVSSNPTKAGCTRYKFVIKFVSDLWWFSSGTPLSSTNKIAYHDIAEILLKVAQNTITLWTTLTHRNLIFNRGHNWWQIINKITFQILTVHTFYMFPPQKKNWRVINVTRKKTDFLPLCMKYSKIGKRKLYSSNIRINNTIIINRKKVHGFLINVFVVTFIDCILYCSWKFTNFCY